MERWDGKSWSIQPIHRFPEGELSSVSCTSKVFCAAVGSWTEIPDFPLSGRWNGRVWSFHSNNAGYPVAPAGVSCVSPTACEGVGSGNFGSGVTPPTVTWHWNGKGWSEFDDYGDQPDAFLGAVSCTATLTCLAVGNEDSRAIPMSDAASALVPTASPAGSVEYELSGVSCAASTACASVGFYQTRYVSFTKYMLVEGWDGSSWSVRLAGTLGELAGVSCVSPSACTAVGRTPNSAGELVPLVESTIPSATRDYAAQRRW